MRLGLILYRIAMRVLSPFTPLIMRRRVAAGKENPTRLNERFARALPPRPAGDLIWFHGASVGECQLQLEIAAQLLRRGRSVTCLFTCQTLTGADTITSRLETDPVFAAADHLQQMAPLDLAGGARRFIDHWQPSLALFAEGEIWPNLLTALKQRAVPTALVNARMTESSIVGWGRWPKTARHVFGLFDLILAADTQTRTGLEHITGHDIPCPGNLKSSLPSLPVDAVACDALRAAIGPRRVLVAASTHGGEEALVLDAVMRMQPRPFLIVAPRHPDRGDEVERLLRCSDLAVARRSHDDPIRPDTDILLADTMGEMGLWYQLADTVYLGGGHAAGVGGHNPLEPLRMGRRVLTGPSLFNFRDLADKLVARGGLVIIASSDELVDKLEGPAAPDALLKELERDQLGPMQETLAALEPLLDTPGVNR